MENTLNKISNENKDIYLYIYIFVVTSTLPF